MEIKPLTNRKRKVSNNRLTLIKSQITLTKNQIHGGLIQNQRRINYQLNQLKKFHHRKKTINYLRKRTTHIPLKKLHKYQSNTTTISKSMNKHFFLLFFFYFSILFPFYIHFLL